MKIRTRALAGLCVAAFVAAAPAAAGRQEQPQQPQPKQTRPQGQTSPGSGGQERRFWWRDAALQKELELSPRQVEKIEKIWNTSLSARREMYKQLEALEAETDRLIRENTADERVLAQQLDRLEAVRSQVNKSRTLMVYRIHQALTPEQHRKLSEINDRRRKAGGRR